MAFFSTGSCSFHCPPRHGLLGNQSTALIKALTSCLRRKRTRSLLVSFCLEDCSANHNMFINDNKQKNETLSVPHWLSNSEIESGRVMNVESKKGPDAEASDQKHVPP